MLPLFALLAAQPADDPGRTEAERIVSKIEVEVFANGEWAKVKRITEPLLRYGDPTRNHDRGSVWAWVDTGRPAAVIELFQDTDDRTKWVYTICNTSGGKVKASINGNPWWRENTSAADFRPVPDAPPPAADAAGRQRQMKQLAQKFAGHQFWDPNNTRYELRRLDRPLHTYRDETAGLLDGGLFTLANGTNPELLLMLEAHAAGGWKFAAGRVSHAELHLEYAGKEVFTAPRGDTVSGRDKPYWLGLLTLKPSAEPKK